ncbi:MAG TPA: hypothetical protein VJ385_21835 [Fibrobacteria bacterium]|nr:hypothetical protein [Fibrobacteria bacterium]
MDLNTTPSPSVPGSRGASVSARRAWAVRLPVLAAMLLACLAVWSCNTGNADDVYTVTFKLDSTRVGKFDSIMVQIYNGPAPGPGDTLKPVQVEVIKVAPTTKEVTIELNGKVKKDFSVVITGFSGKDIAYRNLHAIDGFTAPDTSKPAVLLITRIDAEDLTLSVGETRAPNLTFTPDSAGDKRFVLTSKDSTIVKAEGDLLVGMKAGTAKVIASTPDHIVSFEFNVTVTVVRVAELKADSLFLKVGDTTKPAITVLPANATDKSYRLESSDSSVFKTVGASVVALKAGKARLFMASSDGGAEDTLAVEVRVAVAGLSGKDLVKETGDTFAPILEWTPADATHQEYTLSSKDSAIVAVRGDSLEAKAVGTATVVATSEDGDFMAEFGIEVKKKVFRVVGVKGKDLRGVVGDTLVPDLTWNPANSSDKGFTLRSLDTAKLGFSEERILAKALGKGDIELTTSDGGIKDTFSVSVEVANFKLDVLPITTLKCAPCHVPGTTLNFQDSVTLLLNGVKALDRLERPVGDPAKMPVAGAPNGSLDSRQLGTILEWLNARVVPLKGVMVANDTVKLGKAKDPVITWNPANASNKSFTLTSLDTSKVEVIGSQLVGKALGQAQVQLRALEGDRLVTFSVTVIPIAVDSIRIADTTASIGDTVIPVIQFNPYDATNQTYSLSKLRPASLITTVLPGKRIVAQDTGKDTLVAVSVDGSKVSQFVMTVGPLLPTAISVPDTNGTANGPLVTPRLIWKPANTTNKAYTLTINPADSGIAAVRTLGTQIQGKTEGVINVTAVSTVQPSVTATFKFTVGPVPVEGLSAAPTTATPGQSLTPTITWTPANATNKSFTMVSNDTSKVKIAAGLAVTYKLGTTTVTVTSVNGSKTAPWSINIIRSPFTPTIKPIIVTHCGVCHNSSVVSFNWQDSATSVLNRLEILRRINLLVDAPGHMPPKDSLQLNAANLTILRNWMSQE